MPNKSLEHKNFVVTDKLLHRLKINLEKYGKGNEKGARRARFLITNGEVSYSDMKRIKNYFDNYEGDGKDPEYKLNGGDLGKEWVESELGLSRDIIDSNKRTRMEAGEQNMFKKTHTKDSSANPTEPGGLVNVQKTAASDAIKGEFNYDKNVREEITQINKLIKYLK
jgi:hypothetical protein